MNNIKNARTEKQLKGAEYCDRFYGGFADDVANWALERPDQAFLSLIAGGHLSGRALWCNRHIRDVAQHALIDALLEEYQIDPDRRRYWITLAWDLGITMEREPKLDLVAIRNTAQHHLRRAGLDGFGIVEFDAWKNLTGEPGRRMVAHVHFLGWPADPGAFKWQTIEKGLQQKRGLHNSLGARSVVIEPVRGQSTDIAHLAMYMTKAPSAAKNMVPGAIKAKLRPAELSKGSAARLVEVLSHVEATDVIFSIGEGRRIASAVRRAIRAAIKPGNGKTAAPSHRLVKSHWHRIRLINGSKLFREPKIITRVHQREKS